MENKGLFYEEKKIPLSYFPVIIQNDKKLHWLKMTI